MLKAAYRRKSLILKHAPCRNRSNNPMIKSHRLQPDSSVSAPAKTAASLLFADQKLVPSVPPSPLLGSDSAAASIASFWTAQGHTLFVANFGSSTRAAFNKSLSLINLDSFSL